MEKKDLITKEINKYAAIEAMVNSEGGQLIIKSLKKDIKSCIDEMISKYRSASHTELIATSAKLAERITMYRTLTGSSQLKKIASKDLEELLKEEEQENS